MTPGYFHLAEPTSPPPPPRPSSSSPSSPTTPSPPSSPSLPSSRTLTPPSRLYLRTLLPTPPLSKSCLSLPPATPYPWIWRCHLCNSLYRLGVTRRCLEDGHFFCSVPDPTPSPVSPVTPPSFSFLEEEDIVDAQDKRTKAQKEKDEVKRKMVEKKRAKKTRGGRKAARGCCAEFDYSGWSKYNSWCREVRISSSNRKPTSTTPALQPPKSRLERLKHWAHLAISDEGEVVAASTSPSSREPRARKRPRRNCWKDCDFPSECHNKRKAEREWEARMRMERLMAKKEEDARKGREIWMKLHAEDLGSPSSDVESDAVIWGEVLYGGSEGSKSDPHGNLHGKENVQARSDVPGSLQLDDPNLGPMGTDCDGLGESAFQTTYITARRRKSIEEGRGESPPSSPLKCGFGFEESIAYEKPSSIENDSKEMQKAVRGEGREADLQVREERASRGRNLLLRRVDVGDERFGDEVKEEENL